MFGHDPPAIVTTWSKQRSSLIVALLVARVHAVADQQYPRAFVRVRPIHPSDVIQTHGRGNGEADDRPIGMIWRSFASNWAITASTSLSVGRRSRCMPFPTSPSRFDAILASATCPLEIGNPCTVAACGSTRPIAPVHANIADVWVHPCVNPYARPDEARSRDPQPLHVDSRRPSHRVVLPARCRPV